MAIAKGLGCLRRIGFDEERVRVRQRHCKVVQLAHNPANLAKRLTKVHLCVARCVHQRHEHLPRPPPPLAHIIGHNRDPAGEAMFIAQTLIYPPRCVPLLLEPGFVLLEYLVDDRNERVKLWTHRRVLPAVSRRHRMLQDLRHSLAVYPEMTGRRPLTHPTDMTRTPNPTIQFHRIHLPALSSFASGVRMAEFYSATVRLFDRFCGPVLLRDSHLC